MTDVLGSEVNRRHFLKTGLAASLGMIGVVSGAHADSQKDGGKKDDPFGGFTVGIQSYTFRKFTRERCLKGTQDLGLHYIEFYREHLSPNSKPDQIKAVLKQCGDYGIKPIAFGVERFTKKDDENKKLFDF